MSGRTFALPVKNKAAAKRANFSAEEEVERTTFLRRMLCAYVVLGLVGSVLLLYGSLDFTFWTYQEIKQIMTSAMTPIESHETWGIGPKGLTVQTAYCASDIGCKIDLDYYVQFERAKNIESNAKDWPEEFSPAVENCAEYGHLMLVFSILALLFITAIFITLTVGISVMLPTWLAWACVIANGSLAIIPAIIAGLFYSSSQDVVALLKTDSIVVDTAPEFVLSWGAIFAFVGPVFLALCTGLLVRITIGHEMFKTKVSINDALDRVRMGRIRQYQEDLNSTSHSFEEKPIDTAPSGAFHGPGWTRSVLSRPGNHVIEIGHDCSQFNAPDHVLVNGIKPEISRTARILPFGDIGQASGLIPSLGSQTHKPSAPPLSPISDHKHSLATIFPDQFESTTPISLIGAKERTRTVTRAPALGPLDRPAIEGFFSASASKQTSKKKKNEVVVSR